VLQSEPACVYVIRQMYRFALLRMSTFAPSFAFATVTSAAAQAKGLADKATGAAKDATGSGAGPLQGAAGDAKQALGDLKQVWPVAPHNCAHKSLVCSQQCACLTHLLACLRT
jgi:uncharacterized protein YjbJ (UPF0337 family)